MNSTINENYAAMGNEPISAAYPFRSHFLDVLGSRMHYIDEGEGQPILLQHGNGVWSYLWRNVIPHLRAPGRRILAPDLIGMGLSAKPQSSYGFFDHAAYFESLIEALRLRNVILVLHDWGSGLGLHYAARHPENVRALILMESLVKPWESWEDFPERFRGEFRMLRDGAHGWDMVMKDNIFIEKAVPASQIRKLTAEEMERYREPFQDRSSRKPTWRWPNEIPIEGNPPDVHEAMVKWSQWLQRSPIPKLLLYGTPGAIIKASWREWCEQHIQNLETLDIGPGIHYLMEDNPHGIGRAASDWISKLEGEGR